MSHPSRHPSRARGPRGSLLSGLALLCAASTVLALATSALAPSAARSQVFKPEGTGGEASGTSSTDEGTSDSNAANPDKTDKTTRERRDEPRPQRCGEGKVANADTDGHCCWPGQAWNGERCVGVPTQCPSGFESRSASESCELVACAAGRERVDGVHCCWPGQGYAESTGLCVGEPSCPAAFEADGTGGCREVAAGLTGTVAGSEYGTMIRIPAGEFVMGCKQSVDLDCASDEKPYGTVALSEYEIDRTEVPVSAYALCVKAGACTEPATGPSCNFHLEGHQEHPVNCVTWSQAYSYCTWAEKRLPTEAEWEKAARGDTQQIWPWGNTAGGCERANLDACGERSAAIAQASDGSSPYGTLDMAGNVAEWVSDWYAQGGYGNRADADPRGPESGTKRGVRGGSFLSSAKKARTTARQGIEPTEARREIGFRCARTVR